MSHINTPHVASKSSPILPNAHKLLLCPIPPSSLAASCISASTSTTTSTVHSHSHTHTPSTSTSSSSSASTVSSDGSSSSSPFERLSAGLGMGMGLGMETEMGFGLGRRRALSSSQTTMTLRDRDREFDREGILPATPSYLHFHPPKVSAYPTPLSLSPSASRPKTKASKASAAVAGGKRAGGGLSTSPPITSVTLGNGPVIGTGIGLEIGMGIGEGNGSGSVKLKNSRPFTPTKDRTLYQRRRRRTNSFDSVLSSPPSLTFSPSTFNPMTLTPNPNRNGWAGVGEETAECTTRIGFEMDCGDGEEGECLREPERTWECDSYGDRCLSIPTRAPYEITHSQKEKIDHRKRSSHLHLTHLQNSTCFVALIMIRTFTIRSSIHPILSCLVESFVC
ncbi:hypothetical protein BT69DRAFT_179520 [Atractiella rhizophila]|nr:hypothetical protein BT69DRAFT_179520 [Atractiella rhizophila]